MVVPKAAKHCRPGISYDTEDVFTGASFKDYALYVEDFDLYTVTLYLLPGQNMISSQDPEYMGREIYSGYISSTSITPPTDFQYTVRLLDDFVQVYCSKTHTETIPFTFHFIQKED